MPQSTFGKTNTRLRIVGTRRLLYGRSVLEEDWCQHQLLDSLQPTLTAAIKTVWQKDGNQAPKVMNQLFKVVSHSSQQEHLLDVHVLLQPDGMSIFLSDRSWLDGFYLRNKKITHNKWVTSCQVSGWWWNVTSHTSYNMYVSDPEE